MSIYLVRHGQTEWNTEGRKQGQSDSELTGKGIAQAKANAKMLKSLFGEVNHCTDLRLISSPLKRARDSAKYIQSALGLTAKSLEIADEIMEIAYGNWEGLTNEDVDVRYPGQRKIRNQDRWNYIFDGGESYGMVYDRVTSWMSGLAADVTNVVITHDMVSRLMRGHYLGLDNSTILSTAHPHDVVYLLENGIVTEYRCDQG